MFGRVWRRARIETDCLCVYSGKDHLHRFSPIDHLNPSRKFYSVDRSLEGWLTRLKVVQIEKMDLVGLCRMVGRNEWLGTGRLIWMKLKKP